MTHNAWSFLVAEIFMEVHAPKLFKVLATSACWIDRLGRTYLSRTAVSRAGLLCVAAR
jgi:hypothetical protein